MTAFTFKKNGSDVTDLVLTPADFTSGPWHTDTKSLTNIGSITVDVEYEELTPDGADVDVDFRLQAVLEGLADNGKWYRLVSQNSAHHSTENAPVRRLVVTESTSDFEQGREHIIPDALGSEAVAISHEQASIPDDIRVCIVLADVNSSPAQAALTSVKVSLSGVLK